MQKFIKLYGKLGLVIYLAVSISTIAALYLALDWGIDISQVTEFFNLSAEVVDQMKKYEGGSKFVIAYAISKALMPARLSVSLILVYILKNFFKVKF